MYVEPAFCPSVRIVWYSMPLSSTTAIVITLLIGASLGVQTAICDQQLSGSARQPSDRGLGRYGLRRTCLRRALDLPARAARWLPIASGWTSGKCHRIGHYRDHCNRRIGPGPASGWVNHRCGSGRLGSGRTHPAYRRHRYCWSYKRGHAAADCWDNPSDFCDLAHQSLSETPEYCAPRLGRGRPHRGHRSTRGLCGV